MRKFLARSLTFTVNSVVSVMQSKMMSSVSERLVGAQRLAIIKDKILTVLRHFDESLSYLDINEGDETVSIFLQLAQEIRSSLSATLSEYEGQLSVTCNHMDAAYPPELTEALEDMRPDSQATSVSFASESIEVLEDESLHSFYNDEDDFIVLVPSAQLMASVRTNIDSSSDFDFLKI